MAKQVRPRILLIGPELILGWTESAARALESLGCPVSTIFYNQSRFRERFRRTRRSVGAWLSLPSFSTPHWLQRQYAAWLSLRAGKAMVRTARAFQPDLVLVLKGESLRPTTLRELKEATRGILAVWWVDHPFMNAETQKTWEHVPGCIPLYDHCFVFDRVYEGALREAGAQSVSFLPCAADQGLYKPLTLTLAEREFYGTTVSLVGVYSEHRGKVVSALCHEPGLGIWGPGWDGFFSQRFKDGQERFRGESLVPSGACKVYNASLVNLNTHHPQTQRGGVNTRAFEILASGGFELMDDVPEMDSLMEPGREVGVYRCPEEAAELTRYYLKAPEERRRVAKAGYRRALAEHTYRHRMQRVLSILS